MLYIGGEKMRYPLVKQRGLKDCGPCSLASIIIYYKGYVSVDSLEQSMNTTIAGTTAYDLISTARRIGFDSNGQRMNMCELEKTKLPVIAHVTIDGTYNHFIVIYKIDKRRKILLIGDPASKVKYMNYDEFNKIWNNIIVTLRPLKPLPYTRPVSLLKYVSDILRRYKLSFINIIFISNIFIASSLIYSIFIKYLIDDISVLNKTNILIFMLVFILKTIFLYSKNIITIKTSKKISLDLTKNIIKSLLSLPYPYYRNHTTGEIVSRFNDVEDIKTTINESIVIISEIPLIIIFIIIMFYLNRRLSLYIYILISVYLSLTYFINKILKNNINLYQEKKAMFNSLFTESISGLETIKGINVESTFENKLNNKYVELENTIYKYQFLYNIKDILTSSVISIGDIMIIGIGFMMYHNNLISIGTVILEYVLYNYIIDPLSDVLNYYLKYNESSNVSRRIQEFNYKESKGTDIITNYDIKYHNLTYKQGIKTILNNINLNIKSGAKVFITGPSGSGKSTLVKLLKGFYKVDNLFIGNNKIDTYSLDKILYIGQSEQLFTDTLYNNLMCSDYDKVKDIVKMCLVDKDINMYIEENGFNLSGGEKERIVLARTLLRNFNILIIDEGLSEVDINNERIILKNIFNRYKDKTIIVISHRMENLDLYDQFIEISEGKIVKNLDKHFD